MPALPVLHHLKLAWPQQAGCLLSQCTVATYQLRVRLKGWLKGLKGLKHKPFSHFPFEYQRK